MHPANDDRYLLLMYLSTGFVLTDSGHILHDNAPDRSAGPRLYPAGCTSGNVVRLRHDVGEATARAFERPCIRTRRAHG